MRYLGEVLKPSLRKKHNDNLGLVLMRDLPTKLWQYMLGELNNRNLFLGAVNNTLREEADATLPWS